MTPPLKPTMLPRVGWYLDVKTITVTSFFFFFLLVTLTSETPLNPVGRYVSVVKALHFLLFGSVNSRRGAYSLLVEATPTTNYFFFSLSIDTLHNLVRFL